MREPAEDPYTEALMQHFRNPRNRRPLPPGEALAEENNPLCGDRIRITLRMADGVVRGLEYDICGCAVSIASASMMSCIVEGKSPAEARRLAALFQRLVTGGEISQEERSELGEILAFQQMRSYPVRRKCALLPWRALEKALNTLENRKEEAAG
ncbi:MAG: SUF system NifU family Fe-S cluster assembly protein [Verrucomicrobia bacterium]|nr:MAG: SUF system NifU family Fe-S cluster assembly protein [Verrucomicrobiota bacterium]